jgi:hypothetical protein
MTVQHADLFHCLACGRVAYEPHGGAAPDCCGQPMVRAVADVVREIPPGAEATSECRGDEEHALFAEVVELSQWCHRLTDVDISRAEELANRLSVLHQALYDQIEDAGQSTARIGSASPDPDLRLAATRLRDREEQLLASLSRFVAQLRCGPSPFANWAQICDRFDELVAEFRQYVQSERCHSR